MLKVLSLVLVSAPSIRSQNIFIHATIFIFMKMFNHFLIDKVYAFLNLVFEFNFLLTQILGLDCFLLLILLDWLREYFLDRDTFFNGNSFLPPTSFLVFILRLRNLMPFSLITIPLMLPISLHFLKFYGWIYTWWRMLCRFFIDFILWKRIMPRFIIIVIIWAFWMVTFLYLFQHVVIYSIWRL